MIKLNIHEAKTHLSRHLSRLLKNREEVIVLCRRNVPVAEIRALPAERLSPRPIGLARGQLQVPQSFFAPLPDEVLAGFRGE